MGKRAFRVLINGRNFLIQSESKLELLGFFTTRFVLADSVEEAERLAVDIIQRDSWLQESIRNRPNDPPMLYADEIEEVEDLPIEDQRVLGFTFYPAAEDREQ